MRKFFVIVIALVFATFGTAAICIADELVKKPTFKDLEGKWEGTYQTDGKGRNSRGDVAMTFLRGKNGNIEITSTGGQRYENVTIIGSKIAASNMDRETTWELYRKSNGNLKLKGTYTKKGAAALGRSKGGESELEKK